MRKWAVVASQTTAAIPIPGDFLACLAYINASHAVRDVTCKLDPRLAFPCGAETLRHCLSYILYLLSSQTDVGRSHKTPMPLAQEKASVPAQDSPVTSIDRNIPDVAHKDPFLYSNLRPTQVPPKKTPGRWMIFPGEPYPAMRVQRHTFLLEGSIR